jgi:hypothetical protein
MLLTGFPWQAHESLLRLLSWSIIFRENRKATFRE